MRQELAIRLLARVYADGNVPSKVELCLWYSCGADNLFTDPSTVLVEFHEAEIHGQVFMIGMTDTASDHKISLTCMLLKSLSKHVLVCAGLFLGSGLPGERSLASEVLGL